MKIRELQVFSRSISFELENNEICTTSTCYDVALDGETTATGERRNVGSLYGLCPGTTHTLTLRDSQGEATATFTTKAESYLLDVRRFGACGDGVRDDTSAIQAAIACCPHGGTVLVPAGTYAVTPLFLKSHMTLYLSEGAALLGIPDRGRYPVLPGVTFPTDEQSKEELYLGAWEGNPLDSYASLVTGIDLEDVDITGPGTLDANAQKGDWWIRGTFGHPPFRPRTLFLSRCRSVRVQGITLKNSYAWTIHPFFCEQLGLYDLTIINPADSPNTDGIDPESCTDLRIIGARISVGDDCIVLKSGKMFLGERLQTPTSGVCIRNCLLERGHGGVVLGSEISGGVRDVEISQCRFIDTDRGLRVKTRRGRGNTSVVDGIFLHNLSMRGVVAAFTVNMFYHCGPDGHSPYVQNRSPLPADHMTPRVGSIRCRDIVCEECGAAGIYVCGLPEQPVEELLFENISFSFTPDAAPAVPVMADEVEPVRALALHAENVRRLRLTNVRFTGCEGERLELCGVEDFKEDAADE